MAMEKAGESRVGVLGTLACLVAIKVRTFSRIKVKVSASSRKLSYTTRAGLVMLVGTMQTQVPAITSKLAPRTWDQAPRSTIH